MRVLGLDLGERRIGVALSDDLGLTAQGLTVLQRKGPKADVRAVCRLAAEHEVGTIVVGLPLTLRGARGPQAQGAEVFAEALRRRLAVPVELVDERFTTAQGERMLLQADVSRRRRKQVLDQVAAQLILQQYLDSRKASE